MSRSTDPVSSPPDGWGPAAAHGQRPVEPSPAAGPSPTPQRATERPKTAHPLRPRTILLSSGSAALFAALLTVVIWLR